MIKNKRLKLFSKALSRVLLVLAALASYRGYSFIISAFREIITKEQVSFQSLYNLCVVLFGLLVVIMIFSAMLTFSVKGKFIFNYWFVNTLKAIFSVVLSIGIYVYYLEQTGFYKTIIIPIIPLASLVILSSIFIYDQYYCTMKIKKTN